tara:strand:+ start:656 stop:1255 length:600 start_codon:yes stop_codon:yes gene_type:complete
MKQLMENWRKFVAEAEKEEQEKKDFKAHMMYDPKTGDGEMAKSHEEHLKLKDKGWTHDKPDIEEAKNKDGKEQGADGKACWDGYRYAGTDEDGKDKCVPMEESDCSDDEDEETLEEETDKDRMACNKPRYIKKGEPSYGDKQKVVKACDGDKEKIIRFGDANMENKSDNKDSKANFRSRHSCEDKKDKMSAGYWSCKDW